MDVTAAYRASRDQLLALRGRHEAAVAESRWPQLGERFNWAVDWFDAVARDSDRPALVLVEEDGTTTRRSYAEMSRASDRLAAWLAGRGVGKGDRVILMLGNQVELWESMLAVAKLGAVIMPTTGALGPADLADRIERGGARFVIANSADAAKFDGVPGDYGRIAVGYPVGHMSTMAWIGVRPGDVHLAISSPGWAKHAWSCFFAPWIAEATIFVYNYRRFDAAALLDQIRRAG